MLLFTYIHLSLCSHFLFCVHFQPCAHSLPHLCSSPHSCSLLLHSDLYICTTSSLSLLVPNTCFLVLILVAHAYFWLDANSMLSSHLFTSCSCHIFKCFLHTLFASCTVIILCTPFAFIYIFSSFMHLLYSYFALASVSLFCPYSAHCSFSFVSLFTFISPYYLISYLVNLGSPITHLPIFPHVISSCPSYLAIFLGFLFIRFPFFSPFQCSALPRSSPTLHHHLPLLHSLLLSPPSFTHLSTSFLTFFHYFTPRSFPFSFLLHIWRHIRLALFCNIVVNI